jgi:hypothetical protein
VELEVLVVLPAQAALRTLADLSDRTVLQQVRAVELLKTTPTQLGMLHQRAVPWALQVQQAQAAQVIVVRQHLVQLEAQSVQPAQVEQHLLADLSDRTLRLE